MAHNPPRFEWSCRHPAVGFANQLLVNSRPSGEVAWCEDGGATFYVGIVHRRLLPGRYDTLHEAQAAVEEDYRNHRWG